jgi:hypothetical protein
MFIANYIGYILGAILIGILIWIISNQIKEHHLQDDPMLYTLKEILKPVHPIMNKLKLYKGNKSYTINKEKVFLCLHDEKGEYYPLNMEVYVLLHEVAHVLNTKDVGHTEEFHRIFDDLLQRATQLGVYNPSIPIISDYCNS